MPSIDRGRFGDKDTSGDNNIVPFSDSSNETKISFLSRRCSSGDDLETNNLVQCSEDSDVTDILDIPVHVIRQLEGEENGEDGNPSSRYLYN